jgi:disulfide bond formation protein DsbB
MRDRRKHFLSSEARTSIVVVEAAHCYATATAIRTDSSGSNACDHRWTSGSSLFAAEAAGWYVVLVVAVAVVVVVVAAVRTIQM